MQRSVRLHSYTTRQYFSSTRPAAQGGVCPFSAILTGRMPVMAAPTTLKNMYLHL